MGYGWLHRAAARMEARTTFADKAVADGLVAEYRVASFAWEWCEIRMPDASIEKINAAAIRRLTGGTP